ncbi:MAG: DUF3667 domain-containing protein [Saprospiraceae bacterium]
MEDNKNDISNDELNTESEVIDFEEVVGEKCCYNCNSRMQTEAKFCSNCGQKHTTGKIPVSEFIYNFFKTTFNIDAKLPKTLGNLLIFPGRLTKEFFKGRHQSYLKPMQLFVVMTILCFTIIAFKTGDFGSKFKVEKEEQVIKPNIQFNEGENKLHFLMGIDTAKTTVDSLLNIAKKELKSSKTNAVLDSIFQLWMIQDTLLIDSLSLPIAFKSGREGIIKIAKKDFVLYSGKELIKLYDIEGFVPRILFMQGLKSVKHEDELIGYFVGYLSWAFFLLVPFLALTLKLIYVRRKQFYVEHLVFSLHFQAFAFTLFSIILLIRDFSPPWLRIALICYVPIYLFIGMKSVYQQSLFKTLLKYILLIISYLFLLTISIVFILIIAFILF